MKKNLPQLISLVLHSLEFKFKLFICSQKQGPNLLKSKLKDNTFSFGPCIIRGRPKFRLIGKRVRFLGRTTFIFSEDDKGALEIGDLAVIEDNVTIAPRQGNIILGEGCFLGPNVLIQSYENSHISIGKNSMLAKDCNVLSSNHQINDPELGYAKEIGSSVTIGENVWLGAGVTVLPGVKVSDFCVIAAGSIVTKDTDKLSMYAGVPAHKIKTYDLQKKQWVKYEENRTKI